MPLLKLSVRGPFPPFPVSEVQIRLSVAVKPVPVQLHGDAGHTTETRLLGPVRLSVTVVPLTDVADAVVPSVVPSAPSCDHCRESFDPWPAWLVTRVRESAQAAAVE